MKAINLSGDVGYEITDRLVTSLMSKYSPEDVEININSYGGDAFEGFAIYNSLKQYKGSVTTITKGIAASAAGIIYLAGSRRKVYKNSTFMAHPAWGLALGEGDILISRGKMLNDITGLIAADIARLTGKSVSAVLSEMSAEMWIVSGENIVSAGIAGEVLGGDDEAPEPASTASEKVCDAQNRVKALTGGEMRRDHLSKIAASAKQHGVITSPEDAERQEQLDAWDILYNKSPAMSEAIPPEIEEQAQAWESLYDKKEAK